MLRQWLLTVPQGTLGKLMISLTLFYLVCLNCLSPPSQPAVHLQRLHQLLLLLPTHSLVQQLVDAELLKIILKKIAWKIKIDASPYVIFPQCALLYKK